MSEGWEMDEYGDDIFDFEGTEIEQKTNEYMDFLRGTARKEIMQELQELRAEVTTLREFKRTVLANEREFAKEKKNLEREFAKKKESLERDVKNARLRELFGEYIIDAWRVKRIFTARPKCDKCNEERMIEFISPRGKLMTEFCACAEKDVHYEVATAELAKIENCRLTNGETEWRRKYFLTGEGDSLCAVNTVYDGKPFEDMWYAATQVIFLDEQKCKEFCDYLNKKSEEWDHET